MGDGGGSTTLAIDGGGYNPVIVNKPSGEGADGQRPVAVKMGIKLRR
jgi:hypothetical protein